MCHLTKQETFDNVFYIYLIPRYAAKSSILARTRKTRFSNFTPPPLQVRSFEAKLRPVTRETTFLKLGFPETGSEVKFSLLPPVFGDSKAWPMTAST